MPYDLDLYPATELSSGGTILLFIILAVFFWGLKKEGNL